MVRNPTLFHHNRNPSPTQLDNRSPQLPREEDVISASWNRVDRKSKNAAIHEVVGCRGGRIVLVMSRSRWWWWWSSSSSVRGRERPTRELPRQGRTEYYHPQRNRQKGICGGVPPALVRASERASL